jgi:hypothetical protein
MSGFGRKEIKDWMYGIKSAEHQKILNECGCEDEENESLYDGSAPTMPPSDGEWSPEELYRHFDVDQDGKVTMEDYADHIAHHAANPDLTAPFQRVKQDHIHHARCPDSYEKSGDMLIQVPGEIIDVLKPLMQKLGVGCPASLAHAMADVLDVAMDQEVVKPFKVG